MAVAVKTLAPETQSAKKMAWFIFFRRLFIEKPLGAFGLVIVVLFFFIGIFADFLTPHDYLQHKLPKRLKGPSAEYLLGNDHFGRDVLSRLIVGARISMVVGVGASFLTVLVATVFGLISGYWGGRFDLILQRFVDAVMCFPWLFIVLTVMGIVGAGDCAGHHCFGGSLGHQQHPHDPQRGLERQTERLCRSGHRHRMQHPENPHPTHPAPDRGSCDHSLYHYHGRRHPRGRRCQLFGIWHPAPRTELGRHAQLGRSKVFGKRAPMLALWPGLCLAIVVFGINMFGDAMRDLLDPKLKLGMGRFHAIKKKNPDSSIRGPRPRR